MGFRGDDCDEPANRPRDGPHHGIRTRRHLPRNRRRGEVCSSWCSPSTSRASPRRPASTASSWDGSPRLDRTVRPAWIFRRARGRRRGPLDGRPRRDGNRCAELALLFEGSDPRRPIVMGKMFRPQAPIADDPTDEDLAPAAPTPTPTVENDGERLVFEAGKEIVLRCGQASITLTRAGKILIRGAYVLTRSSGVNRIQGGSVRYQLRLDGIAPTQARFPRPALSRDDGGTNSRLGKAKRPCREARALQLPLAVRGMGGPDGCAGGGRREPSPGSQLSARKAERPCREARALQSPLAVRGMGADRRGGEGASPLPGLRHRARGRPREAARRRRRRPWGSSPRGRPSSPARPTSPGS